LIFFLIEVNMKCYTKKIIEDKAILMGKKDEA
jgi:hypothetical protein